MASIAHPPAPMPSTISDAVVLEERRPQAGPLPRKRGELGFRESIDGGNGRDNTSGDSVTPLPPRHPADRDVEPPPPGESNTPNPNPPSATASNATPAPNAATSTIADASSTRKSSKSSTFLSRFNLRPFLKKKIFGGVPLGTVLRLVLQIISLVGTIVLWIVVTRVLAVGPSNDGPATGNESPGDPPPRSDQALGSSATIFLHVSFGIVTLVQLLFLERCIFFVRAQRYAHTHHDTSLPIHSRNGSGNGSSGPAANLSMSLAPWNRPPLPTYAAALAQSGVGTGDVEDNLIAIPPPPAYGHTRDSTLLLAGFMPGNIRRSASQYSSRSWPISLASRPSRPVSYRSHDEEWEQRCDAERALRLAETLGRLENAGQSSTSTTSEQASH